MKINKRTGKGNGWNRFWQHEMHKEWNHCQPSQYHHPPSPHLPGGSYNHIPNHTIGLSLWSNQLIYPTILPGNRPFFSWTAFVYLKTTLTATSSPTSWIPKAGQHPILSSLIRFPISCVCRCVTFSHFHFPPFLSIFHLTVSHSSLSLSFSLS